MYKGKRFRLKPVAEVLAEIAAIPERYRSRVDRVFLADGDAAVYPLAGLATILDALAATFPGLTRVGAYASPRSLTTKSPFSLSSTATTTTISGGSTAAPTGSSSGR